MARTSIQTRTHKGAQQGFTLIEMAIAVAIFGLLASGAIMATSAWLGKQALDKTAKNLDRIESALTVYMVQMGRLPCPYDPTTVAPGTYVDCTDVAVNAYVGLVPYRDLGLQRVDVLDGWNRYITYAVDGQKADGTPFNGALSAISDNDGNTNPFLVLASGGTADSEIEVQDGAGEGCKTPGPAQRAVCAAYVLISHGEAGRGGFANFNVTPTNPPASHSVEQLNSPTVAGFDATVYGAEPAAGDEGFEHILRYRTAAQILREIL